MFFAHFILIFYLKNNKGKKRVNRMASLTKKIAFFKNKILLNEAWLIY